MTALFAPDAAPLGHPYWWDGIDWPELNDPPPVKVDLLVIGAGYTGLSAAIAAHDAGASVAVIDAGQPGKGASTRNGGMVGAHPRLGWDALAKTYGEDTADAIFAEAGPSLEWLRSLIEREGIDCDLQDTGRIQLAYTRSHFKAREALAGIVREKSRLRCEVVTREGLSNEIVTPLYHGGIVLPDHAAFQPAKFHLGLLEAVDCIGHKWLYGIALWMVCAPGFCSAELPDCDRTALGQFDRRACAGTAHDGRDARPAQLLSGVT